MADDKPTNPCDGGTFESFLREEGIYEETTMAAQAKVIAWLKARVRMLERKVEWYQRKAREMADE